MSKITIEHDEVCPSCKGTGLYVGMGERNGAAVVCHKCNGTGCYRYVHTFEPFEKRRKREKVKRVYETNPGICIGEGRECRLEDFGGMPFEKWLEGKPFPKRSENRKYTCPAWWYQSADYDKKPRWDECIGCGSFSRCGSFSKKEKCWEKFDKMGGE